ncbi:MAG: DinB family protein [Deinococcota bacterium]
MHMMVHDAHHRGQILLALKTSGHTLPDEGSFWMPWK